MANLCPKCRSELVNLADETRTTIGYGCRTCGGVFVESAVLDRLSTGGTGQLAAVGEAAGRLAVGASADGPALCMVCERPMGRRITDGQTYGVDGLVLEHCEAHGTWFDARELTILAEALAARQRAFDADVDRLEGGRGLLLFLAEIVGFRRRRSLGL